MAKGEDGEAKSANSVWAVAEGAVTPEDSVAAAAATAAVGTEVVRAVVEGGSRRGSRHSKRCTPNKAAPNMRMSRTKRHN